MTKLKKEALIFICILIVLAIGVHHKEFIENPIEHIIKLPSAGAYGLGALHPIIFTAFVYILGFIPRFLIKIIKK